MKKVIIIALAAFMLFGLVACGKKEPKAAEKAKEEAVDAANAVAGGWTRAESPVVTDEIKGLLEKAAESKLGAEYKPVALLASQVVSGMNYALLCRIAPVTSDPVEKYAIVHLYKDLNGNAEITDIIESGAETHIADGENLAGGWAQPDSPELTEEAKAVFDKALEGFTGVNYVPVALAATQVVAGINYCIVCESTVVYPGAETGYSLVYVYGALDGSAEVLEIVNFGEQAEG